MVVAEALLEVGETSRKIWLYDVFEGGILATPTNEDFVVGFPHEQASNYWDKKKNPWGRSPSLSEVKERMLSTGYPEKNIVFVKGKVEDTIPGTMPDKIALLRLDTDWYESTKHELVHLFPLLAKNGVLIIDDYDCWAGAKKATDDYFSHQPILLNRIEHGGRLLIKIDV